MGRALVGMQPDIVHPWLVSAIAITHPIARVSAPRARRLAAFRGMEYPGPWMRKLLGSQLHGCRAITINSPLLTEFAVELGADAGVIEWIPNGVRLPDQVATDLERHVPLAACVSNLRPLKGLETLIDAVALLDEPLTIHIFGSGALLGELTERAARAGVADRFVFRGSVDDVPAQLADFQFAVHPSHGEGMSNAILEEMSVGLPIVATDVGATSQLVADGENGLLVQPGDAVALAHALTVMATSPALRKRAGAVSCARAADMSWDSCAQRYESLYYRALQ